MITFGSTGTERQRRSTTTIERQRKASPQGLPGSWFMPHVPGVTTSSDYRRSGSNS